MNGHFRFLIFDFRFADPRPPLRKKGPTPPGRHKSASGTRHSKPRARLLLLVALGSFASVAHAEDTPRAAMRDGLKAYQQGDYTNAVARLEKTVLEFPAIGHYNLGNARYRLGEFEAAADCFNEALRSPDVELQAKAYFNRANALLARTTDLPGPEQIDRAIELAFQAMDLYEQSMLLAPNDRAAKQNYERAQQLRIDLEYRLGRLYFEKAEELLTQYKAKDARTNYQLAQKQFNRLLENVDASHAEAKQHLPKIAQRLQMLALAVEATEFDLKTALKQIEEYQYLLAAQRLASETDERKYAFDLKPELKKQYEETIQKNQQILEIIQNLFPDANKIQ